MTQPAAIDPTSVGAVIVNFNAGECLIACVNSCKDEGIKQIVVADNGSTDTSLQALNKHHADVQILHLPNPGYGAAANKAAQLLTTEFVFALNADTELRRGSLQTLVQTLQRETGAGAVGPRIEDEHGEMYPSARRFPSYFDAVGHATVGLFTANNKWSRTYKAYDLEYDKERPADWISGAAMLFRKEAFDAVAGFDESYWMYLEDVDICWRLHKSGWYVMFQPDATVLHIGAVSTKQTPVKMLAAHHRSLARFASRTATNKQRLFLPVIYAGLIARFALMSAKALKQRSRRERFG